MIVNTVFLTSVFVKFLKSEFFELDANFWVRFSAVLPKFKFVDVVKFVHDKKHMKIQFLKFGKT